jgi:hypothetical protein
MSYGTDIPEGAVRSFPSVVYALVPGRYATQNWIGLLGGRP